MKPILRLTALATLLLAHAASFAGSSLVLSDGQVIKGTEIRRDGDSYQVSLADGNVAVFPASLVREIRIDDDAPPAPPSTQLAGPVVIPPGSDNAPPAQLSGPAVTTPGSASARPTQLAGPVVPPPNPSDQLKVFGPPTKWSKDAVDTTWVPTNAYDPNADVMAGSRSTWSKSAVDTAWVPTNAYDPNADVMASSKSTWSKSAVDTTWNPQDGFGFKKLSFKGATEPPPELVASIPQAAPYAERPAAAPQGPAPWTCAETIFVKDGDRPPTDKDNRAASLKVKPLKTPLYASLGLPLYEAEAGKAENTRKAVFTIAGGACRLVGGDSDVILGLNLTPDHAMAQDGAAFNTAMASRGGAKVPAGVDKLDYALAFVSLTDPLVSGARAATLKLLAKPEDLRSIAATSPKACALGRGKRRKQERAATAAFATPKISAGQEGDVVTFLSWSSAGGTIYRNTVVLSRGGVVSADRTILASHVGAHTD